MAALQHMISFAPSIHSTVCKDTARKRNGHVVRVSGALSEEKSTGHDGIHQVKDSPFKRNILRGMQEPSPIQKAENDLMDYCSTLEGDEGYRCWEGYFEFEDLKVFISVHMAASTRKGQPIDEQHEAIQIHEKLQQAV